MTGIAAKVTVSAPATVRLSLRAPQQVVGVATRKLANAGTTTVRVRLRAKALRALRATKRIRLVLRAARRARLR